MPIKPADFRRAMSHFITGVAVVTTQWDEELIGATVNSLASVSDEPPSLLVCINSQSRTCSKIKTSAFFSVNILSKNQAGIASVFAKDGADKMLLCESAGVSFYRTAIDTVAIEESLCRFDCCVVQQLPYFSHTIFIAQVLLVETVEAEPLHYFKSSLY